MADKKNAEKLVPAKAEAVAGQKKLEQQKFDEASEKVDPQKATAGSRRQWIIIAVVVVVCAGTGFGLGRLFGWSGSSKIAEPSQSQQTESNHTQLFEKDSDATDSASQSTSGWFYDFDPVVANLNEPSATRYIRVALTLQISTELDQKKLSAFIEEKKPLLKNWLTIYLANQTLEDIRGDRNLLRIQSEILDAFNERLFPDAKPKIKNVLFSEFAVQ